MPFEIPSDLHPDLVPVAWLLGTWKGSGHGDYPTIDAFHFDQEVVFAHDGRPFLHYFSRAQITDEDGQHVRNGGMETGFLRAHGGGLDFELVLAHNTGIVEVWYGEVPKGRQQLELATDAVVRTTTAKDYTAGRRLYGLVEGDLMYALDMAAMGQPMQSHTWGRLQAA